MGSDVSPYTTCIVAIRTRIFGRRKAGVSALRLCISRRLSHWQSNYMDSFCSLLTDMGLVSLCFILFHLVQAVRVQTFGLMLHLLWV